MSEVISLTELENFHIAHKNSVMLHTLICSYNIFVLEASFFSKKIGRLYNPSPFSKIKEVIIGWIIFIFFKDTTPNNIIVGTCSIYSFFTSMSNRLVFQNLKRYSILYLPAKCQLYYVLLGVSNINVI